ncbi:MAG: SCP2 sterol-binding domain-containing protein [Zoogloeaceae bacterium]|jgi:predicted lipid carrier protein YhbT|nr:SCP2 sterol-binding domain-containing protein [Zoogloeaceae bacterium]
MNSNFKLPDFTLPAPLMRLGAHLPQTPPTLALIAGLNLALGRMIPREPLEPLLGKRFVIRVTDAGLSLRFAYGSRGFKPIFDAAPPDLTISAKSRDFIALMTRAEDPDTLFFSRRLLMEGDTDLGLLVKNTLDGIELPRFDATRLMPAEALRRLRERLTALRPV